MPVDYTKKGVGMIVDDWIYDTVVRSLKSGVQLTVGPPANTIQ